MPQILSRSDEAGFEENQNSSTQVRTGFELFVGREKIKKIEEESTEIGRQMEQTTH